MGESKLLLALFCNKILTKSEQGVVVVVISWRSGCVTLTVTLQLYRGGECVTAVPEFSGHTITSLRYLFASVIKNHASKKLNTPIEKLSLKQIAAFADENYKQRKLRKTIEKRQHDLIEYFESLVKLNKIDNFL